MAGETEMSYLDMSDEELAAIDPSTIGAAFAEEAQEEEEEVATEAESEQDEAGESDEADSQEEEATNDSEESEDPEAEGNEESNPEQKASDSEAESIDYKHVYEKITAPFKANGREIQVKNVEDAIALMQMGANYNKKMAALKPNLKLMKMLENNGLLNEERLNFLIDLEKKNPDAIGKLLKDSGLDPLELDTEKAGEYRPTQRTIDDREIELDTVLDEIQESPTYNRTLDIVSNRWDGASKQVIANSPQLLKVINNHVQMGIYDLISKEIENERMYGRLEGLSDIEAYRQVGDAIQARNGFAHLSAQGQQIQPKPVVVPPKPKTVNEDKLREKKRAAASTNAAPQVAKADADFNPLAMSDAEFAKIINKQYL